MSIKPNFLPFSHSNLRVSHTPKPLFLFSFTKSHSLQSERSNSFPFTNPKTRCQFVAPENEEHGAAGPRLQKILKNGVGLVASILPGGRWWTLLEQPEDDAEAAEPTAVMVALRRMWELVADEKLVAFGAIGSLVLAALSEISMPSILAASIFSAQNGETLVFSRNALLLVLLCFTSGICSGLRSGCFGILNVTLVKRLRENLYTAILFQDISYFDKEKVGDLTSRLAADCQQLSHVIGNDLHLILRNTLQGTGAIVNLLALSWPLALSALLICSILSAIFLVYGQ